MEITIIISKTYLHLIGWTFIVWAIVSSMTMAISLYQKLMLWRLEKNSTKLGFIGDWHISTMPPHDKRYKAGDPK